MGFGEAIRRALSKYADFSGRASRPEFWWFALLYSIVGVILVSVDENGLLAGLAGLGLIALFIPYLSVTARRLHDLGRSGWYQLLGLIPLIGPVILIIWLAQQGKPGDNAYGPDPRAAPDASTTAAPPASTPASSPAPMPASGRPAATPTVSVPGGSPVDYGQLERLAKLHADGVLTDEEFRAQKARILGA